MKIFKNFNQRGQILPSLVVILPFFLLMVSSYVSLTSSSSRVARQDQLHTEAQLAADAGADYAIEQVNQNGNWSGATETTLHNDGSIKTTYAVSVTNNSASSKTLTATGRSYWPASSTSAYTSVSVKVDLRPVQNGSYSIISGEGGLIMSNSSKVVAGDVFINGTITLSNTAQIGLSTNPVNVSVADQACPVPADATYPRLCNANEGPTPIAMSNTPHIYGTVKANNQTSGANMTNPGLVASSGVVPQPLPTVDRAGIKAAISSNLTGANASCSSGTKTWAANTKITGDVTISNSCKVTVQGNIWITGALTLSNSGQMIVADSLGVIRPVIMVDSSNGATFKNTSQLVSNASSTGFEIVTFWSSASCSPDCITVTGTDLSNSRATTTITIDNTTVGPQSIYYSYWSQVLVKNSGQIGALIGQTIKLQNTGTITFGTSTGTGSTFWVVSGYRRSY